MSSTQSDIHPTPLNPATRFVAAGDQVSSMLGDEVVILNMTTGLYHGVDGVAAFIWKMLARPVSGAEICDAVMREYDVESDRCRQDVADLLADLSRHGLVRAADTAAP